MPANTDPAPPVLAMLRVRQWASGEGSPRLMGPCSAAGHRDYRFSMLLQDDRYHEHAMQKLSWSACQDSSHLGAGEVCLGVLWGDSRQQKCPALQQARHMRFSRPSAVLAALICAVVQHVEDFLAARRAAAQDSEGQQVFDDIRSTTKSGLTLAPMFSWLLGQLAGVATDARADSCSASTTRTISAAGEGKAQLKTQHPASRS
jgi:hypothetical protein